MRTPRSIRQTKPRAKHGPRREAEPSKAELERMLLRTALLRAEAARERSRD